MGGGHCWSAIWSWFIPWEVWSSCELSRTWWWCTRRRGALMQGKCVEVERERKKEQKTEVKILWQGRELYKSTKPTYNKVSHFPIKNPVTSALSCSGMGGYQRHRGTRYTRMCRCILADITAPAGWRLSWGESESCTAWDQKPGAVTSPPPPLLACFSVCNAAEITPLSRGNWEDQNETMWKLALHKGFLFTIFSRFPVLKQ